MKPDVRARRQAVWERFVLHGEPESEVIAELAGEYDVATETVREDLSTMDEWLWKLYRSGEANDVSALLSLQANRHRLQQMATDAQANGALELELRIRKELTKTIRHEERISDGVRLRERTDAEKMMDDMM